MPAFREDIGKFTKETWEHEIIRTITILRLPFQTIEHPQMQRLLKLAQSAPSDLDFPSAKTISRRLHEIVNQRQESLLQTLPKNAKLSIALDCWTSPFQQAFMAVTGYFIDNNWNYREILLGFLPLHGTHSGANLSTYIIELFQKHNILDRVLSITTDNASNNNTLIQSTQESLQSLELNDQTSIIRIPCVAHVIQLCLKQLLGQIKANPKNETTEREWTETESQKVPAKERNGEIAYTLNKVNTHFVKLSNCQTVKLSLSSLPDCYPRITIHIPSLLCIPG